MNDIGTLPQVLEGQHTWSAVWELLNLHLLYAGILVVLTFASVAALQAMVKRHPTRP